MTLRFLAAALGVALATLPSCKSPGPVPDVDPGIAAAMSLGEPLVFETEAEPVDLVGPSPVTLTRADAVERALRHDPRIQAAFARVRAAEADARQARLLPNPILNVAVRRPEGGGTPGIDISLAQDLFSLVTRPGASAAADDRLRAASAECLVTALDVVAEADEHYVAAQAVEAKAPLVAENAALLVRLRDLAASRLAKGEGVRSDVTSLDAERVAAEIALAELDSDRLAARLALARLIGRPSDPAQWTIEPWTVPSAPVSDLVCVAAALQRRPEIQRAQWDLAALGEEQSLAALPLLDGLAAGPDFEGGGDWSFGASAEIPLPVFDVGQARRDKALAQVVAARHELSAARRRVVEEVRAACAALDVSRRTLARIRDDLVPLGEARRAEIESAYRSGEADVTALLVAEQHLQTARVHGVETEQRIASALARLRRAVGGSASLAGIESSSSQPAGGPRHDQP